MIRPILRNAGFNPRRLLDSWRGWQRYEKDRTRFRKLQESPAFVWGRELPILNEWDETSGSLGAYFLQDQLVARWIYQAAPDRHVDVGSRLDGFIGSVSVFREVEVIDIRPQPEPVSNVKFHQLNLMEPLTPGWLKSTDSLSCLHTIEHFGLGRYGDPIDPGGYLKGLGQLKQMVAPGGTFYLSTPIGPQRIEFNAHRVFAARTVLDWFADNWSIEKLAVIDDSERIRELNHWTEAEITSNFGCNLGVGIVAARRVR